MHRPPYPAVAAGPRSPVPRILVLDDEPAIRALVARALGEEGYEVVTVANVLEALETAHQDAFDLVITNNCMRGMSGLEVIERLHQVFPALPVLHIDDLVHPSADEFPEDVRTLHKPFSIVALQDAVRKLLAG